MQVWTLEFFLQFIFNKVQLVLCRQKLSNFEIIKYNKLTHYLAKQKQYYYDLG